jgi:hypothetical protein
MFALSCSFNPNPCIPSSGLCSSSVSADLSFTQCSTTMSQGAKQQSPGALSFNANHEIRKKANPRPHQTPSNPIKPPVTAIPPAPSILSRAFSSSSLLTSTLTPLAPFLPFVAAFLTADFLTGVSSPSSSSPAALAFFGVLLALLLGVLLSTPPAGPAAPPDAILVRFREFQRARREPLFL